MRFRFRGTAPLAIALALVTLCQTSPAAAHSPYAAENDLIEVMFVTESAVRLRDGALVDLSGTNALEGLDRALASTLWHEWFRICDVPETTLDDIEAQGEAKTGHDVYNLNNIYRLRFGGGPDVWALGAALEALPGIGSARPVPLPVEPPLPPDYQPQQNYEDPAASVPTGVDAEYAWTQAGGTGTGVTVCDIEYSWNYNHNDITKAPGSQINVNVSDPFGNNNHGTAVIGELVSDDNAPNWGTKGVCFGAGLKTCGSYYGFPAPSWNVPGAIAVAIANLNAGDIILLEQQWPYTSGGTDYVPIEWWTDYSPNSQTYNGVYAAIVNAVSAGIHVVEAGGNGNVNTGAMTWYGDSGAIIVGAGGAYPGGTWPQTNLERLSFSSYGPRFNLQGWGENVVTTGYGDLFSIEGVNRYYTQTFSGTSSASPIVAGAAACVQGYYLANISPTPLSPVALRTLLVNTGTPQFFGLAGNIGPRPDCFAAIQALQPLAYEYGDAPEFAPAYPSTGVMGQFPTCVGSGPAGSFVRHGPAGAATPFLGPAVDYETDGNAGNCPNFPPYDADQCWSDGDAGLMFPPAYTIDAAFNIIPCQQLGWLGSVCAIAFWGTNLDLLVQNPTPYDVYVNVLMDWDQSGNWQGSAQCPTGAAPEHVLVDWLVPAGFVGPLSALQPPPFLIGPNGGFVWSRFTICETPVSFGWNGAGVFAMGETSDYLLQIEEVPRAEYGDAPEGSLAYPPAGVMGLFPTCTAVGPAGIVSHASPASLYLGPSADVETDGNAGNCPNFPPYDADECWNDGDAGLLFPTAFTIDQQLNYVPCDPTVPPTRLGNACTAAQWGVNLDLSVVNNSPYDAYVNVLVDWDASGNWQGSSPCPTGAAFEHVLVNFIVPAGFAGPLSALGPPPFLLGPHDTFVWSRFTISDMPVAQDWDGSGAFSMGETSDYLLLVDREVGVEDASAPILKTRLLPGHPNPFSSTTTIRVELAAAGMVQVAIYDVAGRRIRTLVEGARETGRYAFDWDGRNESGEKAAAGIYFVRLRAAGKSHSTPVIVLK